MRRFCAPHSLRLPLAFFNSPDIAWSAALDGSIPAAPPIPSPEDFSATNHSAQVGAMPTFAPALADGSDSFSTFPADAGCQIRNPKPETRRKSEVRSPKLLPEEASEEEQAGSNNWAVDGRRSGTGAAIVANDMHLGLSVPNTWYRARLVYTDPRAWCAGYRRSHHARRARGGCGQQPSPGLGPDRLLSGHDRPGQVGDRSCQPASLSHSLRVAGVPAIHGDHSCAGWDERRACGG